jgi:VWFA-related protein
MQISRRSLLFSAFVRAAAQDATFSTDVRVVNLFATVRNKDNRLVKNLTRNDFQLQEDGHPQTIHYFSQETDLPLTLGLLVDTSRSQRGVIEPERRASYTFLEKMLRPDKDTAFVMSFDIRVRKLADLTSDTSTIRAALDALKIPILASTLLYDAVKDASERTMRQQKGRKAFIILSDGVDVHSRTSIGTAIEYAQRADTAIFSILFADRRVLADNGRYAQRGRKALQRLSSETGGSYFEVSDNQPIEKVYDRIQEELRSQYSLGYTPDRTDAGATAYRKVSLTTKQDGLTVRSRDGYYPGGKQ